MTNTENKQTTVYTVTQSVTNYNGIYDLKNTSMNTIRLACVFKILIVAYCLQMLTS